jgi:protein-tyrosine phosphatase
VTVPPPVNSNGEGTALHVLFVCTGNICRSPTAERLAAAYADREGIDGFAVSSAGTRAMIGHPIHPHAAAVLDDMGADSSDFAARQLTPKIASGADLVLTMTKAHREVVLQQVPRLLHRTFTVTEAARLASDFDVHGIADLAPLRSRLSTHDVEDVPDPIGQGPEYFEQTGARIAALLPPVLALCRPV